MGRSAKRTGANSSGATTRAAESSSGYLLDLVLVIARHWIDKALHWPQSQDRHAIHADVAHEYVLVLVRARDLVLPLLALRLSNSGLPPLLQPRSFCLLQCVHSVLLAQLSLMLLLQALHLLRMSGLGLPLLFG